MAAVASRLESLDLEAEGLEEGCGGNRGGRPGRPEIHLPAGQLRYCADIGPREDMNFLRREPGDEFEPVGKGLVLDRSFGQDAGGDKGKIDFEFVEKRKIARAGIAQHGKNAEAALWEQARHVGREHRLRSGGRTGDQSKPRVIAVVPGRAFIGSLDGARNEPGENETKDENATQYTPPHSSLLRTPRQEVPLAARFCHEPDNEEWCGVCPRPPSSGPGAWKLLARDARALRRAPVGAEGFLLLLRNLTFE